MGSQKKIIVALDTTDVDKALNLTKLIPDVGAFKLGLEFFCANGPSGIKVIAQTGVNIFLDLKFHDIPNTVIGAIQASLNMQPYMMTVHLSGGFNMLKKSMDSIKNSYVNSSLERPLILGVSVLTSIDNTDFDSLGLSGKVEDQVLRLGQLAISAGLDGLVCSAKELKALRRELGSNFILVTPGIRLKDGEINDQKRIVTPYQALTDGANYLVIGRPITASKNPKQALSNIIKEM
jgi:orotidine-5'-phosphate decarboxylase